MRRDLRSRVVAGGGLVLTGLALIAAQTVLLPPPRLDVAVGGGPGAHPAGRVRWTVDTVAREQDTDVLMTLRFAHLTAAARVRVRLCPPLATASDAACTAVLFDGRPVDGTVSLGRVATLPARTVDRVLVELRPSAGRGPELTANVTPCALPRSGDLWHRARTRPQAPGWPLPASVDACSTPPPWRLLGGVLIAGGVVVPAVASIRRRS